MANATEPSEILSDIGLVEDKSAAQALNENHYFCSQWSYARQYGSVAGLRPRLQIELTALAPVLPTVTCQIGSLAEQLAGRKDTAFAVATVAVAETIAEKVLSFLRRYAQHRAGLLQQGWDAALVRHIYDVHCAQRLRPEIAQAARQIFAQLVAGDQKEFGGQFPDFAAAPLPVLSGALRQAGSNAAIHAEYTKNLLPLVYGRFTPNFAEAFEGFDAVASVLLATLEKPSREDRKATKKR